MILSDQEIRSLLQDDTLTVEPLGENAVQPASVDLRIDDHFLVVNEDIGYMALDEEVEYREVEAETITVPPNSFVLATTKEEISLPADVSAFVEGRSSIGRMGLFIENAGWVDPGFEGRITLELFNANTLPIKVQAGRRICQLVFAKMEQPAAFPYGGKYQGQQKTVGSYIHEDEEVA